MSEETKSHEAEKCCSRKCPTAVLITAIICGTVLIITITGMIFGGVMANKIMKDLPSRINCQMTNSKMTDM